MKRHYFWLKWHKQSLVIARSAGLVELITGNKISSKDIEYHNLTNERALTVLEYLERKDLVYMVAGYNNEMVAIYNKSPRMFNAWSKKHNIQRIYRLPRLTSEEAFMFDIQAIKYPYYTAITWELFLEMLSFAEERGWIVKEEDIYKRKYYKYDKSTKGYSIKNRSLVNQVIMYSKRYIELMEKVDATKEDQLELDYYSSINYNKAKEIVELYNKDAKGSKIVIDKLCDWKSSYQQIINTFNL